MVTGWLGNLGLGRLWAVMSKQVRGRDGIIPQGMMLVREDLVNYAQSWTGSPDRHCAWPLILYHTLFLYAEEAFLLIYIIWMNLRCVILGEGSQHQKVTYTL